MNHSLRRKIFVAGVVLVVVLLLVYGFLPKAQTVDLASVKRGPLQVTIEEEGRTRLKDRFTVSAPAAGYLRRVTQKVGDTVKKGQVVAELEPLGSQALDPRSRAAAEAAVTAAESAVQAASERQKVAAADARYIEEKRARLKTLYEKGSIAKDEFDQLDSEAKKARSLELSAKAAVDLAKAELERTRVSLRNIASFKKGGAHDIIKVASPVNGEIFRVYRESEGAVNTGEPLMDIGDADKMEVRVEVLSSDAVKIKDDMPVLFKRWGNDEPLTGKVRRVEPAGFTKVSSLGVEEQRVLVLADITSPRDQWRALGDGYRMEAHFIIWDGDNVLQIPASALFRWGDKWAVFAARNGRAIRKVVEVGQRNAQAAEVLSGLNENEKVLAYPDDSISDGTKIKPRK